jgi:hypothetical protein
MIFETDGDLGAKEGKLTIEKDGNLRLLHEHRRNTSCLPQVHEPANKYKS